MKDIDYKKIREDVETFITDLKDSFNFDYEERVGYVTEAVKDLFGGVIEEVDKIFKRKDD